MSHVVDPDFVAKLRLYTRPPKKKASCLDRLTDEQLVEVYHMLASNAEQWTLKAIARHVTTNWQDIGAVEWVADSLSRFSDQVLGPRRGLAKMKGTTSPEEKRVRDRYRKLEERAKMQLNEIAELGKEITRLQDMIDYWNMRGMSRGEAYAEVAKYESIVHDMIKTRHSMKVTEGLVRPAQHQLDSSVKDTFIRIREQITNPQRYSHFLSSVSRKCEEFAEPIDIQKLIPETLHEMELRSHDDQAGECSGSYEDVCVGDEPDFTGSDDC
jgi:hypothetical protein